MKKKKTALKKCDDEWKRQIKERANWACEHCGRSKAAGFQVHAHHLIHRNRHFFRHNLNNGICLCATCHALGGNFSAHCTPWTFDEWLKKAKPEQWAWFEKNRYKTFPGLKIDYEAVLETLKEQANETDTGDRDTGQSEE